LWDRCLNIWAADAVGLVHAHDPEIIVMGGNVMKSADLIVPYVEEYLQKHAWTPWGRSKCGPRHWTTTLHCWELFHYSPNGSCNRSSQ
jgi:hypothetical protein